MFELPNSKLVDVVSVDGRLSDCDSAHGAEIA
jgi:hypothetical protein